jgi:hypothetical protein
MQDPTLVSSQHFFCPAYNVYVYVCIYVCMYVYMHLYPAYSIYMYAHTYMHAYIHTHTHIHTRTSFLFFPEPRRLLFLHHFLNKMIFPCFSFFFEQVFSCPYVLSGLSRCTVPELIAFIFFFFFLADAKLASELTGCRGKVSVYMYLFFFNRLFV